MQTEGIDQESAVKTALDISSISRMHYRLCAKRLESLGVSVGQVPIFMVLMYKNEPVMQHEIAQMIHVTPATISGTLKRMERDGMAVRTADPSDARISRVTLSEKGREISRRAFNSFSTSSLEMFNGFSAEEVAAFNDNLRRVQDNLLTAMDGNGIDGEAL